MKRFVVIGLVLGALLCALVAHSLAQAGTQTPIRPYHQESSMRVVHTAHGYRVVIATSQGQR
jgi:hypothetical protein